jgi:hypothetical protein
VDSKLILRLSFALTVPILGTVSVLATEQYIGGTSIILIVFEDKIIIAADSRVSEVGGQGRDFGDTHVKIHQAGHTFFALAGIPKVLKDGIEVFNVFDVVKESQKNAKLPSEILEIVVKAVKDKYTSISETTENGTILLDMVLANFEDKEPVGYWLRIVSNNPHGCTITNQQRINKKTLVPHPCGIVICGKSAEIFKSLKGNGSWKDPVAMSNCETLTALIGLESIANPKSVGGPVDILEIGANEAKWLKRKKECPDIVSYSK